MGKPPVNPIPEETEDPVVNHKIVSLRWMTDEERDAEGWENRERTVVLVLDNGVKLYAARDEEGNGAGCLVGADAEGSFYVFPVEDEKCACEECGSSADTEEEEN